MKEGINMSGNSFVSVVCAWYERADSIRTTLDSLLEQTYSNFEIIVINDGSKDPRVKSILDTYTDPRLRVIHQENIGFTKTIIKAISIANGDYIAIQGAGDKSDKHRIAKQAELLDNDTNIGIVSCYYTKENLRSTSNKEVLKPLEVTSKSYIENPSQRLLVSHGELMYRRYFYEKAGGYRGFFDVGQGSDLWGRMLEYCDLAVVEEVLYKQIIFSDGVSTNYKKIFHRSLLHGVMLEEREASKRNDHSPIEDPEGKFMPLYLVSRNELSKRYMTILIICYALKLPDTSYYKKLTIANSNCTYSCFAKLFSLLPFRYKLAKKLASKSAIYKRLILDNYSE
ncbi:glycosyltransferase family A protein [Pseudoalteromonas sp. P1-25]|uniref:glycosyltransferase family 2 protein n=1 Tax=Pseudoalteromonas sp. P1-25 TaxID=1723758 RepID=UPI0006E70815|nr:glycosyltransferase family A protein [Pseudoalteromonas sp. P1-25]KPZ51754.1 putative glycosyltransferase EpsJ [Pseudoalteromonas sp. P1-25]